MSTSDRRRRAAAVLALALLALTGGCDVETGNSSRTAARDAAERALGDGTLTIDLRHPPTREDLGVLPAGDGEHVVQRPDHEPFTVTVRFRDGRVLETEAYALGVTTPGPDAEPTALWIRRQGMRLEELRSVLESAVTSVGADPRHVESYLADAERARQGQADLIRTIPTSISPERLSITPVVTALEGRVSMTYDVAWGRRP